MSGSDCAPRPRGRERGIAPGVLPAGPLNAITDVAGVRVGHVTLREGEDIRTGVTAIVPHPGNLFQEKVPAGLAVGNGFGKLTGVTLFLAAIEATEEAIYNSLFTAVTTTGYRGRTVEALPLDLPLFSGYPQHLG